MDLSWDIAVSLCERTTTHLWFLLSKLAGYTKLFVFLTSHALKLMDHPEVSNNIVDLGCLAAKDDRELYEPGK